MKTIFYPSKNNYDYLCARPYIEQKNIIEQVSSIFDNIKKDGDKAVRVYSEKYDNLKITDLKVSKDIIEESEKLISEDLKQAINIAKNNIEKFHLSQVEEINKIETTKGIKCWRESRAIDNIGLYIPGGTAPLFSTVLMLGVPAKLAGCKEIILCTPPNKFGVIDPAILYTAKLVGIKSIYTIGGAQAIAAMTIGTESIKKVDKIFGPGNQYVTAAKQVSQNYGVAIDLPAGPSEVLVIADKNAEASFVAADLLSQAEHGEDSQVILLSDDSTIVEKTLIELDRQIEDLPRISIAKKALKNSRAIVFKNIEECIEFSNVYAPEHLILAVDNYELYIDKISNAGSVFLGKYSCESAGDYASGTNHTLPTNQFARNYSGVSLDSFIKKITFQELSYEGLKNIGRAIEIMAETEQLIAHKNAVSIRLKNE